MYAIFGMLHDMAHSLPVPEADGRVRFPRLVRQQSTRLYFVAASYGLLQNLKYRYTVRAFTPSCPWCLIVPLQCIGRVDTRLPRSQEVILFIIIIHLHHIHIVPFHSPSFQREQLWSRLSRGFNDGSHMTSAHTSRS